MSQYIYYNDPGEQEQVEETALSTTGEHDEVEEKMVMIYESADNLGGHSISLNTRRVVTQSTLHQQPGE